MADAQKFQFDAVFNMDPEGRAKATALRPKTRFTAEELEAARQTAYAEGRASAEAAAAEALAGAADRIGGALAIILQSLDDAARTHRREAANIALMAARKISDTLFDLHGPAHIEAAVEDCLAHIPDTPHLEVRLPVAQYEALNAKLQEIAEKRGFAGRLIITEDTSLGDADCRVSWPEGATARDGETLIDAIAQTVAQRLAADDATINA
ncbi:MAG: FliH/SctL family protein [Pseudomonadota bacterium]